MQVRRALLAAAALSVTPGLLRAQFDFKLADRKIQIHSFASQGFAYSNVNNYLTMKTSEGSFAFTDGGVNLSTSLTDRFRMGAQAYVRDIGQLGEGHVTLDWAFGDYRFTNWLGLRAGKVKTALGLYNDTQDTESLHTWAILPQSLYPLDLRSYTIAHTGADLYGDMSLKRYGRLAYTLYAGARAVDNTTGFHYGSEKRLVFLQDESGRMAGADLRWTTPIDGLLFGASFLNQDNSARGYRIKTTGVDDYQEDTRKNTTLAYYLQYMKGNLRLDGEYRRNYTDLIGAEVSKYRLNADLRGWYFAGAYRVHKRIEVGCYYSRFYPNWRDPNLSEPNSHIFDKVATVRLDLNRHWHVKVEGHLIDGYGHTNSYRGFYLQDQPGGIREPKTNLLVIRTGFSF